MNNPEIFNQNILNQITSEIVVLDKDLKVVWVNDSAITKSWKISDEHSDINSQFSFQTNAELKQLIDDCIDTGNTIIKRDFKLEKDNEKYRIVDLTVNWSESDQLLILEVLCVDNLHKIIAPAVDSPIPGSLTISSNDFGNLFLKSLKMISFALYILIALL